MTTELKAQIEKIEKDVQDFKEMITKSQEAHKKEIKDEVIQVMEQKMDENFNIVSKEHKMLDLKLTKTRKDIKAILQNMQNIKDQKHEQPGSDMSVTASRNSKSPTCNKLKGTQY